MIKEKTKTGVPGLDDMLHGGLIPGRSYIVSGASGTGKTILSMQFLLEGVRNGERVLYVCLDEPPNEVKQNMHSLGWDIGQVQVFDATPDILNYDKTPVRDVSTERRVVYFRDAGDEIRITSEKSPGDMTINTIQEALKQEMKVRKYSRVVIDSLTSLRYFYIKTSEEDTTMMSFFRLLSDLGTTCLLTVQLPEVSKPEIEAHVARGEIRLHKWFNGRGLMRGVTVEKCRGSSHDHRLRTMRITSEGVEIKLMSEDKAAPPTQEPEMKAGLDRGRSASESCAPASAPSSGQPKHHEGDGI